jgi:hypothetical protein
MPNTRHLFYDFGLDIAIGFLLCGMESIEHNGRGRSAGFDVRRQRKAPLQLFTTTDYQLGRSIFDIGMALSMTINNARSGFITLLPMSITC